MSLLKKIIPVVVIDNANDAVKLAELYQNAGIGAIEITLRTERALECVLAIKQANLDIEVGVGTVLDLSQAKKAMDMGVDFLVSPGATSELLDFASGISIPFHLGFATVSEGLVLRQSGMTTGKFFPAEAAGGASFIQALGAVLPGLQVFPTGGIQLSNLAKYLDLGNVFQIGGTWLSPKDLVAKADWSAIKLTIDETKQYLNNYEGKNNDR